MDVVEEGEVVFGKCGSVPPRLHDEIDGLVVFREGPPPLLVRGGYRSLVRDSDPLESGFTVVPDSVSILIVEDDALGEARSPNPGLAVHPPPSSSWKGTGPERSWPRVPRYVWRWASWVSPRSSSKGSSVVVGEDRRSSLRTAVRTRVSAMCTIFHPSSVRARWKASTPQWRNSPPT